MGESRTGKPAREVLAKIKRGELISVRRNRPTTEPMGLGEVIFVSPQQLRLGLRCLGDLSHSEPLGEGERVILDHSMRDQVCFLFAAVDEVVDLGHRAGPTVNLQVGPQALVLSLRAHERYEVPARVRLTSEEEETLALYDRLVPVNISEGGFGLALPRRTVKVGQKVRFAFELMPDEVTQRKLRRFGEQVPRARIAGTAEVRRVMQRPAHTGDQVVYAGFKFLELTDPAPEELFKTAPAAGTRPKAKPEQGEGPPAAEDNGASGEDAPGEEQGQLGEEQASGEGAAPAPGEQSGDEGGNGAPGEVPEGGQAGPAGKEELMRLGEFLRAFSRLGDRLKMLEQEYFERMKQQGG